METVIFRRKVLKASLGLCSAVEGRQVHRVNADLGQTGGPGPASTERDAPGPELVALKELRCEIL